MPELPEVETVMRGLAPVMQGQMIESVTLNRPDLRRPIPSGFARDVSGRHVETLQRRGKYIVVLLEGGLGFVLHLGMSGRVKILASGQQYTPEKHDHILWHMKGGACVVYNDARRFGMVFTVDGANWGAHEAFAMMGPEPLGNEFNGPVLAQRLKGRKADIKAALLDQRVVAGVGNIYACEALHMAEISPLRTAGSIRGVRAETLSRAIKTVLSRAIEAGGSSLKDYRQADGSLGYFQHQFTVYDREGESCPSASCRRRIGDAIRPAHIKRLVQGGRSSFYCPRCQR